MNNTIIEYHELESKFLQIVQHVIFFFIFQSSSALIVKLRLNVKYILMFFKAVPSNQYLRQYKSLLF